jgi:N-acetylmuramoyl-L-alanine amidase
MTRAKAGDVMKHGLIYPLVVWALLGVAASTAPIRLVMAQSRKTDAARDQGKAGTSATQGRASHSEPGANGDSSATLEEDKPSPASGAGQPSGKAQVTGLRFLSWNGYTRIMVDLSREAQYQVRRLEEDPARGMPPRIYIDILGARLALASKEPIAVDDGLLRQVRLGQYSGDTVRVVLDMNSLRDHKAFMLADPYRLVIDVYGAKALDRAAAKQLPLTSASNGRQAVSKVSNPTNPSPVRSGLRKIVLDPGHGGKDPGAIGPGGIAEKDLVLAIAKKLADKLKNEMGIQVVLTRKDDRFVPLEDRTARANSEDADLFISLHMNASPNVEAKGIETYYLDNTTDEAAIRLAARENATSRKNISDLQFILSDMTQNMKLEDSITLANRVQNSLVSGMTKVMADVKDLGVKKALFYVLVGARMPSVLVEMFFITNRGEGRAMSQGSYQDAMVEALFEGIQRFSQSNLVAKTL